MQKRLIMLPVLLIGSTVACAAPSGLYVGAQLGSGGIDTTAYRNKVDRDLQLVRSNPEESVTASYNRTDEKGLSGRLFAGYDFNDYVGIELGYSEFAKNQYQGLVTTRGSDNYSDYSVDSSFKTSAWDINGKVYLPLKNFSAALNPVKLYAKAGMAYVTQKINLGSQTVERSDAGTRTVQDSDFRNLTMRKWQPTYGIGLTYTLNYNLALDASYMEIQGGGADIGNGNFNGFTAKSHLAALGLLYRFN